MAGRGRAARTHGASVIATGTRGVGAARSALLGSVSSGLIQNAELPILVVPDEPAAATPDQNAEQPARALRVDARRAPARPRATRVESATSLRQFQRRRGRTGYHAPVTRGPNGLEGRFSSPAVAALASLVAVDDESEQPLDQGPGVL
jgi:hypothetical protein